MASVNKGIGSTNISSTHIGVSLQFKAYKIEFGV